MNTKSACIEVDGEGIFFDIAIVDAETVGLGSFGPFAYMAIIISNAVSKLTSFVLTFF